MTNPNNLIQRSTSSSFVFLCNIDMIVKEHTEVEEGAFKGFYSCGRLEGNNHDHDCIKAPTSTSRMSLASRPLDMLYVLFFIVSEFLYFTYFYTINCGFSVPHSGISLDRLSGFVPILRDPELHIRPSEIICRDEQGPAHRGRYGILRQLWRVRMV